MPYIKKSQRVQFDKWLQDLEYIETPGELNYVLTNICKRYEVLNGTSYAILNDIIGVLECAKQEYYRRFIAPYEDKKIEENGDLEAYIPNVLKNIKLADRGLIDEMDTMLDDMDPEHKDYPVLTSQPENTFDADAALNADRFYYGFPVDKKVTT